MGNFHLQETSILFTTIQIFKIQKLLLHVHRTISCNVIPENFTLLILMCLIFTVIYCLPFQDTAKKETMKKETSKINEHAKLTFRSNLIFEHLIFTVSFNRELLTTTQISGITVQIINGMKRDTWLRLPSSSVLVLCEVKNCLS